MAAAATADDASPAPLDAAATAEARARLSEAQREVYLQTLDRGLSHIGSQTGWLERQILLVPGGQPLLGDAARAALARCEALTGKILRGLLERLTKPVAQVPAPPSEHSFAISDGGED